MTKIKNLFLGVVFLGIICSVGSIQGCGSSVELKADLCADELVCSAAKAYPFVRTVIDLVIENGIATLVLGYTGIPCVDMSLTEAELIELFNGSDPEVIIGRIIALKFKEYDGDLCNFNTEVWTSQDGDQLRGKVSESPVVVSSSQLTFR